MNTQNWIAYADNILHKTSGTARLDIEVLISHVLKRDRSWVLAHPEYLLSKKQRDKLDILIERRKKHEPIAYILGSCEFYGREFYVDMNVLVPRPESEEIIEQFLSLKLPSNSVMADVGCGSGALGITAAKEKPDIQINFLDTSTEALIVTKRNARKHKVRGQYYQGDLLNAWPIEYSVLLCNLPYVPDNFPINKDATFEPKTALFAGVDGLSLYRNLFEQIRTKNIGKPIVITESLVFQHKEMEIIAAQAGYKQIKEKDLIQVFIKL